MGDRHQWAGLYGRQRAEAYRAVVRYVALASIMVWGSVAYGSASQQLALWTFDSLRSVTSGKPVKPTRKTVTGTPSISVSNCEPFSPAPPGVAYVDASGRSHAPSRALGWADFKCKRTSADGQLSIQINAAGFGALTLRFDCLHSNSNNGDAKYLEWLYSADGGGNWSSSTIFSVIDNNLWISNAFTLPGILNNRSNVLIRIRKLQSPDDATEVNNVLLFDNVEITGEFAALAPAITVEPSVNIPDSNPVALNTDLSDPVDPTRAAIRLSVIDPDTPLSQIANWVTSSNASIATASLTPAGEAGAFLLNVTPLGKGYTDITVTFCDPQTNMASYIIHYAVSDTSGILPGTHIHTGVSDASTAIAIDDSFMLIGNDESRGDLFLVDRRRSGWVGRSWNFTSQLGLTDDRETDIEASTRVGNRVFFLGSLGNSAQGECRPSRDVLYAVDIVGSGTNTDLKYVGKYMALREALLDWDANNGHGLGSNRFGFVAGALCAATGGRPPKTPQGFDLEGFAIGPDGQAYLGFRAPGVFTANGTMALVVPIPNFAAWFNNGAPRGRPEFSAPIQLALDGRGIRSMEFSSFGECLIVGGPWGTVAATGISFALYRWNGDGDNQNPELLLANLPTLASGSVEGIVDPEALWRQSSLQLLLDNGSTDWYGDGLESKDLSPGHQKFISEWISIPPPWPSAITRSIRSATVSLKVMPGPNVGSYAIEERLPPGMTPISVEDGNWDAVNSKITWGPFSDHLGRTLSYKLCGGGQVAGKGIFDGMDVTTSGPTGLKACSGSFVPAKGVFNGLFNGTNGVTQETSGSFTLVTTAKRAFTGNLRMGNSRYGLNGILNANGIAQVTVKRNGLSPLFVELSINSDARQVAGTVSDGTWTAHLNGDQAIAAGLAPQAGKYTLIIPGDYASSTKPGGDSYATVNVTTAGKVTMIGSLSDGTKITQASSLSREGRWPLYIPLYRGRGQVLSWLTFAPTLTDDLSGEATWIKPAIETANFYPEGFNIRTTAWGSRYKRPARAVSILSFTAARLTLSGADLDEDIFKDIVLDDNNRAQESGSGFRLTFALSSGLLVGRIQDPATLKQIAFGGVVLQRQNRASGYFAMSPRAGRVFLQTK